MSEPQKQGLLAAAAQILQASGPSLRPVGFGQVVGSGVGAYQQAKQEAEQNALAAQLRGLQISHAQGELSDAERRRATQESIQAAARGAMLTPEQMAASLPGGPTAENAARIPEMKGSFDTEQFLSKVMSIDPLEGMRYAQQLRKAGPEFDTKPQVAIGNDGKPFQYIVAKDGTVKRLDGVLPRDEIKLMNLGGKDVAYNPYQLQPGQTFNRTMTPGESASIGVQRERLNFDRTQANKPVYDSERGMLIDTRAGVAKPVQGAQGGALGTKDAIQKATDAKDVLSLLDQAEPIVSKATGSYAGAGMDQLARVFGVATDSANNAAQLKAIEGVLVSKMPKMSGPQSDKDVAMYRQMAGQIGDPTVPEQTKLAAMATIREIAVRNAGGAPQAETARKVATLADIAATAKASGKSTAEVTAALRAKGYTIGGQ